MPFRPIYAGAQLSGLGQPIAGTVVTTNNTATVIATVFPPADSTMYIDVVIVGRRTDAGGLGDTATATLKCAYKSIAGVLTQVGGNTAALPFASASINASAASSGASGAQLQIKIAGVNGATIAWEMHGFAYQSTTP